MNLEDYRKKAAALGIKRGKLEKGFPDQINPAYCHDKKQADQRVSRHVTAEKLEKLGVPREDLTHLNPEVSSDHKVTGRMGGKVRGLKEKIARAKAKLLAKSRRDSHR